VVAADISTAMLDRARKRLGARPNESFSVEDGQDLGFGAADGPRSFSVIVRAARGTVPRQP
jgi:hypothetical protein